MSQQTTVLKTSGLYTYPNQLGELPVGALTNAENVVIDRDGVISPRRGNAIYGNSLGSTGSMADQLMFYKARVLRHWGSSLDFDSNGAGDFTNLANNINNQSPGVKIKFQEANGNFYFTTDQGIQKISANSATAIPAAGITAAGGVEALDGVAYLNSTPGWFLEDSQVAYRIVWGITDENNNIVLGTPSQRIVVTNSQLSLTVNDFNKLLSALDIAASTPPTVLTGSITTGNTNTITVSSTTGLSIGMTVNDSGSFVPANTVIQNIVNATTLIISQATTNGLLTGSIAAPTSTTITVTSTATLSAGMTVLDTLGYITSGTTIATVVDGTTLTLSASTLNTSAVPSDTFAFNVPIPSDTFTFGQKLSDTTYSELGLTSSASSTDLYNALVALSQQLDTDLDEIIYYGLTGTITDIIPSFSLSVTANTNAISGNATTLTNISATTGITPGLFVSGEGVPTNTIVTATNFGAAFSITGTTTVSSTTISGVTYTIAPTVGMTISGPGIAIGSTVIDVSGLGTGTITIDQAATSTNTAASLTCVLNEVTISNPVTSSIANTVVTFSYSTTVISSNHNLTTNDQITIVGSNSTPIIDTTNPVTVTVIDANTFTIPTTTSLGGTQGTWTLYPPAVAQQYTSLTTILTNPATTAMLTLLQNFYDAIVNNLNVDENISLPAKESIGGTFANSTQSATTNVIFTIPDHITTAYYYQVYRSDMSTSIAQGLLQNQAADDECKLVVENNPTAQDLTNGYINFFDNVPESFRLQGANLYTNAISGGGILQEYNPPPYSQDIALWQNYMFFANCSTKHQLTLDLLTATGLVGQTITTSYNGITTTYTFVDEVNQITTIVLPVGAAFTSTGTADNFVLYNAQNYNPYLIYFMTGTTVAPSNPNNYTTIPVIILATDTDIQVAAKLQYAMSSANQDFAIGFSANTLTVENTNPGFTNSPVNNVIATGFTITVTTAGSGEDPSTQSIGVPNASTPAQQIDGAARSLIRIINKNPAGGVSAQYLSGPTSLPGQIFFEAIATNLTPFYITSSIGTNFNPVIPSSGTSLVSTNNAKPNYIYYSVLQQPDAVPQVNFFAVGQEDYPILRIMALRDSLFILKADGVFRLYGNAPSNFTVYLFDSSTKLLAQDTAAILNNQVYMFSNQGVVTVSDTGISVISRPIEGTIIPINTFPNYTTTAFGVSYEADRAYLLWLQTESSDTVPTTCYRYSTFTNTWVTWPISKNCGVVVPDTNILYLGPTDTNFIEKERKSYLRFDQADREYVQTIPPNAVNGAVLSLGSVFQAAVGDAMVQTQYLTVSQYNRLITKMGTDLGFQNNYTGQLVTIGMNLRDALTSLATELDTDAGLDTHGYSAAIASYSQSFTDTQAAFNVIVSLLNADPGTRLHNYSVSNYTTVFESLVVATDTRKQTITVNDTLAWIQGPVSIFKAIASDVEWAPQHCGDPSMLKKIYEGTMMFENMAFDSATLSYSSDLYTGTQAIPVNGDGCNIWGGVVWGQGTWGGNGTFRPIRTYIPTPVQRCRFVQAYFDHDNSRRTYAIFGISYTWEPISSRGYR